MYTRYVVTILLCVFPLNAAMAAVRFLLARHTESSGILADAAHAASDALFSIVLVIGVLAATQPPCAKHPHGHKHREAIAIRLLGAAIVGVALYAGYEAYARLRSGIAPEFTVQSLLFFSLTIPISYAISRAEYHFGDKYTSDPLHGDAEHTRADVIASSGVLVGYGAVAAGIPILDPIAAFGVVLYVATMIGGKLILDPSMKRRKQKEEKRGKTPTHRKHHH